MGVFVDQPLLERALTILRESGEYSSLKLDLDEYFSEQNWAGMADGNGPFALAFTRNLENEGGWLPQRDLETFWNAVALVNPQQPSEADDLYQFLQRTITAWKSPPSTSPTASDAAAGVAESGPAAYESVTDMAGAPYAGWKQGYDRDAGVWKYRDPVDGLWRENHEAFPPVASGSRIFRIRERTFLIDGDAEREVWLHPEAADTYYDTTGSYDRLGNLIVSATAAPATAAPVTVAPATAAPAASPAAAGASADTDGDDEKPADQAELERELRDLFEIPPDWPIWVSAP